MLKFVNGLQVWKRRDLRHASLARRREWMRRDEAAKCKGENVHTAIVTDAIIRERNRRNDDEREEYYRHQREQAEWEEEQAERAYQEHLANEPEGGYPLDTDEF